MSFFWMLWILSCVAAVIPVYYFFIGLKDGSITSRNMRMWIALLVVVAAVLVGSIVLHANGLMAFAKGILFVLLVPGILGLAYLLMIIIEKPRWN